MDLEDDFNVEDYNSPNDSCGIVGVVDMIIKNKKYITFYITDFDNKKFKFSMLSWRAVLYGVYEVKADDVILIFYKHSFVVTAYKFKDGVL